MDHAAHETSQARLALAATLHCLSGCAIGYGLTIRSLLAGGMGLREAGRIALASDTVSIAVMEVVDNVFMLIVPGAMDAGILQPLFWGALFGSLLLAGIIALPVNAWLIARGRGHALVHRSHEGHH